MVSAVAASKLGLQDGWRRRRALRPILLYSQSKETGEADFGCHVCMSTEIIKNPGRHAIVASDLSTQIHGELHTSQLGTFSGESVVGLCKLRKDFPYLLYSQS